MKANPVTTFLWILVVYITISLGEGLGKMAFPMSPQIVQVFVGVTEIIVAGGFLWITIVSLYIWTHKVLRKLQRGE